jgi:hypothetical protein
MKRIWRNVCAILEQNYIRKVGYLGQKHNRIRKVYNKSFLVALVTKLKEKNWYDAIWIHTSKMYVMALKIFKTAKVATKKEYK